MATAEILPDDLTARRREVLVAVRDFHDLNGYAPTVREIGTILHVSAPSVIHTHLTILRDHGLVDWADGQARTLHLTQRGKQALIVL